jgi:DNA polymerase-1
MRFIGFDTETHLIRPGLIVPRMVCLSSAERATDGTLKTGLIDSRLGVEMLMRWLMDDDITLIGHNTPFDAAVACQVDPRLLPLVFKKLQKGLLLDTQTRQLLIDVAEGEAKYHIDEETGEFQKSAYSLADLSWRLNKKFVKKADTWRLKYALLDGVPIHGWPEKAKTYAIDDAVVTMEVFETQERLIQAADWTYNEDVRRHVLANQIEQHRASWALYLMSAWGIRTDGEAVAALRTELQAEYTALMEQLRPSGLFNIEAPRMIRRGPRKGVVLPEKVTRHMKSIYARVAGSFKARGEEVPTTETGRVATDRKTLLATGDPQLSLLAEAGAVAKLLTTYVPVLELGTRWPICARYNALMETGRTSCSKPNLQNPPRKGGVRECFIPRPGSVLVFVDYDTLELRAFAQVCLDVLGYSDMAEALRRGEDLHLSLAAELMDIPVAEAISRYAAGDKVVKEARQWSKIANFGFPGGLGEESFIAYAEGFGLKLTPTQAHEIREAWFNRWREARPYFDFISKLTEQSDQLTQLRSGRVRGGASFCAAANGFFQGLAADGAKEALWRVAYECYVDEASPLFGCRPNLFLHDEIGMEVSYDDQVCASAAADRLAQVMIEAMQKWIPDVPVTAKPVMCRRWFKGAEAVRVNGLLVPSRPVTKAEKTVWVPDLEQEALRVAC